MKKALFFPLQVSLCTVGYLYASSTITHAQITSDGTVNTQVTDNGNVAEITGGETRGSNLFHSFQDFSVGTGNEASFLNGNDISNIFSRVTGGNISNIDGLIRANGSANLFLINPNGIIFGENASLNIGGSFYGSSASSILFEDGEFSTADLENPPLLTVNAPIGLGFRDNPGDITNRSTFGSAGLTVNEGQNISLLGGNVNIENGGIIFAPGGRVELGGLLEEGTIDIAEDSSLLFPDSVTRGDVSLKDFSIVSVFSRISGSIGVNAANLELINGSLFASGINNGSPNTQGKDIVIDANNSVLLDDGSSIINSSGNIAQENIGNIIISTSKLSIDNQSQIIADSLGQGNAGNITISTDTLSINNQSDIFADSLGQGNAGNITIAATENVAIGLQTDLDNLQGDDKFGGTISARLLAGAIGNAGNIEINTPRLSISSVDIETGSNETGIVELNTSSAGEGNAGNITLNVDELIELNKSAQISTSADEGSSGDGGRIEINTQRLNINDNSLIFSSTFADGDAGDIVITASETVKLTDSSGINVGSQEEARGIGGEINIETNKLIISDSSSISARTAAEENVFNTGNINLQVEDTIVLKDNSFISARANNQTSGGNINIDTNFIIAFPSNGGGNDILASAEQGEGGNITINAESLFGIQERPENPQTNDINASSEFSLDGNITINTPDINPVQGATELPSNIVVPEQTSQQACQANRESAAKNGLNITGKGGIPADPASPLDSQNVTVNGENNLTSTIPQPIETSQGKIQPARGIKVSESGKITLTAYRTNSSGDRLTEFQRNCGRV